MTHHLMLLKNFLSLVKIKSKDVIAWLLAYKQ